MTKMLDSASIYPTLAFQKITRFAPWARLYYWWLHVVPSHRGKHRILEGLHRRALRSNKRFIWRMRNGTRLVLDPREGLIAKETVGWTCFVERQWEPHVERFLRATLSAGDTAFDVGANIGYFTAVMAQIVGPRGSVVSFEPVSEIRHSLMAARALNGFNQVDIRDYALGSRDSELDMAVDPRLGGSSSLVLSPSAESRRVRVKVRTLDGLLASGELNVGEVKLVKIDTEGSELDVLEGAKRLIDTARPLIIFELNARASREAGWDLSEVRSLLQAIGDYRLHQLSVDGIRSYSGDGTSLREEEFIDLLAAPHSWTPHDLPAAT